jgi:uridine monophosphate synthetase
MLSSLLETDCIKNGCFKLKSGEISKYYFDMKRLISYPHLLKKIGDEMYNLLDKKCDLLCGVPIGGLPICSYISIHYNIPMIIVRNEKKNYGSENQIEGRYTTKNKCVIIEDVITTGGSVQNIIDVLKDKVEIIGIISILDRQQGFKPTVPYKSIFYKTDIVRQRLKDLVIKKKSRLCFSADLDNSEKLVKMLDLIGSHIVVCKIHYDFYNDLDESLKTSLIELSIKHDFLIMEDRKFVDISHTVILQYKKFANWVDLITVMGNVSDEVVKSLSGVLIVANMSNHSFDSTENAKNLAIANSDRVVGFITQKRLEIENMFCMTPGINLEKKTDGDQNYRPVSEVDTDIIIVGRGIYNNPNYIETAKMYSRIIN